jgi:hypothetical protein
MKKTMETKTLRPGELLCELIGEDYDQLFPEKPETVEDKLMRLAMRKPSRKTVRDLPDEERRAYMAAAAQKHRDKRKALKEAGQTEASAETIRDALADAALMLLAVNGPGADQVRAALTKIFVGKPGVPMTIEANARAGKLRPKLLKLK